MPLYLQHSGETSRYAVWKITESQDELLSLLPGDAEAWRTQLNSFKSDSRKLEWLAIRVLFYTLWGRVVPIHYHANGKPYLFDSEGYISISHTKGYVALVHSFEHQVGIDMERVNERVCRLAHKFVSEEEFQFVDSSNPMLSFLLFWTAKEVMFKCMNTEGVDFRTHLHVDLSAISKGFFTGHETRTANKLSFRFHYLIDSDFVLTTAEL